MSDEHRDLDQKALCEASLTRLEASADPAHRPHYDRARALIDIIAGLTDHPDLLGAAALLPLLKGGAIDASAAASAFSAEAARLSSELVRIDTSGPLVTKTSLSAARGQAEPLRKMLMAIFADPRVLLIKLAALLADLRDAKDASAEGRERIALETREIYAPLANRLGVWHLKWELEDLAFRYLEPDNYKRVASWLAAKRGDRERYIAEVTETIERELEKAGVRADVAGRPKHLYSIWRKMQRKRLAFDELYDLRGIRIIVDTVADCYAALGIVHGIWRHIPGEFDDYIATPKDNFYRSLHTAVVGPGKLPVEIQIRTREMHEHAELGVAAHWRYKEGGRADAAYEQKIAWLRQLLEPGDRADGEAHGEAGDEPDGGADGDRHGAGTARAESDWDFIERVRAEIFEDRVYVISPRGEVVELPNGATPLDYAYQVHTELGHRCRGAKVNGRMVPLNQRLANGDQVEILTGKLPNPSRDWLVPSLGYLASPRNRYKVRAWFRKLDEAHNRAQGKQMLERELKRLAIDHVTLPELISDFHCDNAEQLYQLIGEGEVTIAQVTGAIQRRARASQETPVASRRTADTADDTAGIRIEGVGDLMSTFARCCHPVPPEEIAGYITVGRGVTIHRKSCANLERLADINPERVITVEWGTRSDRAFPVDVNVRAYDRRGLVRDITAVLADSKINIHHMNTWTDERDGIADMNLRITVQDLEDLSRVLNRIQGLPNVLSAQRKV